MNNLFPFIAVSIFLVVHFWIYFLFFKKMVKPKIPLRILKYFLIINYFGILGYFLGRYYLSMPPVLYFFVSLSIGVAFVLFVVSIVYQILNLALIFSHKRRHFFKQVINIFSGIFASGYLGWGIIEGKLKPEITRVTPKIKNLKMPFSAVQISDLHIGGLIEQSVVRGIVEQSNALGADIIFLTGDIIDIKISNVSEALKELAKLKAPLGVYYIVGNHEYFHGIGELLEALKSLGIRVLENENIIISKNGEELFNLIGVYDLFGRRIGALEPHLKEALTLRNEKLPTLLLAHQPKFIKEITEEDKIDMMLCGHTHGGQIFPFRFLVTLDQPYLQGLYQHSQTTQIYVNRGTGYWGPPMRILARAEITHFEFLPKDF
ncbi:metallophosphoesterase [Helicobacter burdigaliensis]|uniref:metallophosphoesterase n=1 Tax=Helicobacter burdigaliensis TaxID=2315334 RepID=UPI000EF70148|nr:metallophosphoesterase [Helicobacter burdigaliensis]